jgi:hypothetical protein
MVCVARRARHITLHPNISLIILLIHVEHAKKEKKELFVLDPFKPAAKRRKEGLKLVSLPDRKAFPQ